MPPTDLPDHGKFLSKFMHIDMSVDPIVKGVKMLSFRQVNESRAF